MLGIFFNKEYFIYLKDTVTKRKGNMEIFHVLIHCPNSHSGQGWAKLKGARGFIQLSYISAGTKDLDHLHLLS